MMDTKHNQQYKKPTIPSLDNQWNPMNQDTISNGTLDHLKRVWSSPPLDLVQEAPRC